MGVSQLTTYLRDNAEKTSSLYNLSAEASRLSILGETLYLAVDGHSFSSTLLRLITEQQLEADPDCPILDSHGSSYPLIYEAVHSLVSAFRSHNIELQFFYDALPAHYLNRFKELTWKIRDKAKPKLFYRTDELESLGMEPKGKEKKTADHGPQEVPDAVRFHIEQALADLNVFRMGVPGEARHAIAYLINLQAKQKAFKTAKNPWSLESLVPGLPCAVLAVDSDFAVFKGCRYIDLGKSLYVPGHSVLSSRKLLSNVQRAASQQRGIDNRALCQSLLVGPMDSADSATPWTELPSEEESKEDKETYPGGSPSVGTRDVGQSIWAFVHSPELLAESLGLQISNLPELAAFAGCNYTTVIVDGTGLHKRLGVEMEDCNGITATAKWMRATLDNSASRKVFATGRVQEALAQCDNAYHSKTHRWLEVAATIGLPKQAGSLFKEAYTNCMEAYGLGLSIWTTYEALSASMASAVTQAWKALGSWQPGDLSQPRAREISRMLESHWCSWRDIHLRYQKITKIENSPYESPSPPLPKNGPPALLVPYASKKALPAVMLAVCAKLEFAPKSFDILRPLRAIQYGLQGIDKKIEFFSFDSFMTPAYRRAPQLADGIVVPCLKRNFPKPYRRWLNEANGVHEWIMFTITTVFDYWHPSWNHRLPYVLPSADFNADASDADSKESTSGLALGGLTVPFYESGQALIPEMQELVGLWWRRLVASIKETITKELSAAAVQSILGGLLILRYIVSVQTFQSTTACRAKQALDSRSAPWISCPPSPLHQLPMGKEEAAAIVAQMLLLAHIEAQPNVTSARETLLKKLPDTRSPASPSERAACSVFVEAYQQFAKLYGDQFVVPATQFPLQLHRLFDGVLFRRIMEQETQAGRHKKSTESLMETYGLKGVYTAMLSAISALKVPEKKASMRRDMFDFLDTLISDADKVKAADIIAESSQLLNVAEEVIPPTCIALTPEKRGQIEGERKEVQSKEELQKRDPSLMTLEAVIQPGAHFIPPEEYISLAPEDRKRLAQNATVEYPSTGITEILPLHHYAEPIMYHLWTRPVVIISSDTGGGKSTQVPQLILRTHRRAQQKAKAQKNAKGAALFASKKASAKKLMSKVWGRQPKVIVTQPRRITAISQAERVAQETGGNVSELVGYRIKGESKVSKDTVITYCTAGWLAAYLSSDLERLNNYTHYVIDEVRGCNQ